METLSCLTSKIWAFEFEFRPSKVNSGQKYFCCSKAHNIISYSIFDFNVFRVWPLTSKSHLGLKKVIPFKAHIWIFIWLLWTPALYLVPFSSYSTPKFSGLTLTFDVWTLFGVEKNYTIRKPIYDFLFDFHGHHLSISYRYRYIRLQSV